MPDLLSPPSDGVHYGVPAETYHRWDAVSQSMLSRVSRSVRHALHAQANPPEPTPAMRIGSAIHTFILEPETFRERYAEVGHCSAKTGKGTACSRMGSVRVRGDWWCGQHAPNARADDVETIPSGVTMEALTAIHRSLAEHQAAEAVLWSPTRRIETSLVWTDPATSLRCKARLDLLDQSLGVVGDLKTTKDASPGAFVLSAFNFQYDVQAAFYLRGLDACALAPESGDPWEFLFVAVEGTQPHAVAVYRVDDDDLEMAEDRIENCLRLVAEADVTQPAFGHGVHALSMAGWMRQRRETELTIEE